MKILCPRHEDTNPSCEVYQDGAYCYSGCGPLPLSEIGINTDDLPPKPKEDVEATLTYISSLPIRVHRGFGFPADSTGFYICWPNASYYKKRSFDPAARPKYVGPTGHKPPLFWASHTGVSVLAVIEGELEALSLAAAELEWDVVSPGSAVLFTAPALLKHCISYQTVIIAVDNDGPGIKAAQDLAAGLVDRVPKLVVLYKDKERDFNKVLCEQGVSGLKHEVEKRLSQAVCWESSR